MTRAADRGVTHRDAKSFLGTLVLRTLVLLATPTVTPPNANRGWGTRRVGPSPTAQHFHVSVGNRGAESATSGRVTALFEMRRRSDLPSCLVLPRGGDREMSYTRCCHVIRARDRPWTPRPTLPPGPPS